MSDTEKLTEIRASEVTVEVKDARSGLTLRRTLPIDYLELPAACRGGRRGEARGAGFLLKHRTWPPAGPDWRRP